MTLLRTLVYIENIFGVYRNYQFFNNKKKILAIIRFISEIIIALLAIVINVKIFSLEYERTGENKLVSIAYQIVLFFKVTIVLVSALRYSESFTIYYKNVKTIHRRFKNDPFYAKSNKILNIKCAVIIVIFVTMVSLMIIWGINDSNETSFKWTLYILIISEAWIDSRFLLEHLVAFCALTKIKDFLMIVNNSVNSALQYFTDKEDSVKDEDQGPIDISERVNTWTDSYQHILVCTQQVSQSFNKMSVFSIAVVVFQCVCSVYTLFDKFLKKTDVKFSYKNNLVYLLIYHIIASTALLISGQSIKNEVESLKKTLARLILKVSTSCPKSEARQIKDLYRLVCTSPILIQFNKYPLGIYILPMILSLSATYIVVMLQINHVV